IKGTILSSLQEHAMAEENFFRALELSDAKDEVYYQIAGLYQMQGAYLKAITYLKKCLKANKDNQEALYEIAFCYDVLDQQQESIQFYMQYIDTDPYSFAAWYNLGNAYHKLSDFNAAIDAYDYAILINESFS